mgnify:CR=1 FL=1|jgi:hypothetical protein|tara:strand:- start:228 stop:413 length:186 start_codon:yes stop_codon:yes gene_type:complete
MAVYVVSHTGNDFEFRKSVFDSNIAITKNFGIADRFVLQAADDPDNARLLAKLSQERFKSF